MAKRLNQIKFIVRGLPAQMPDNSDPAVYRYRAKGWRRAPQLCLKIMQSEQCVLNLPKAMRG